MRGSRRHFGRTLTCSSRNTGCADERLHLGACPRADLAHHRALLADEDPLLRLGLDVDEGAHAVVLELLDLDRDRVRDLLARQLERLLADDLGDALLEREVGRLPAGKYAGPSGRSETRSPRSSPTPSFVFALTGWSAWKSPSAAAVFICDAMCAGLSRSTLFSAITTGFAEPEHAPRDEAVARRRCGRAHRRRGARRRRRRTTSRPSAACARSAGRSGAGSRAGRRARAGSRRRSRRRTPPPRRVGDGRGDRDLLAAERVDERRLADVRRPRRRRCRFSRRLWGTPTTHCDRNEEVRTGHGACRSSQASGQPARTTRAAARRRHRHDSAAVAEDDALDAHLVQPLPAAAARRRGDRGDDEVPGPVALRDRPRERRPLRAHAERIGGVLDVHALDHAAVAREHRAARRGSSSTARTRAPRPRRLARGARRRTTASLIRTPGRGRA